MEVLGSWDIHVLNFNRSCQFALFSGHANVNFHHHCTIVPFPNTFVYIACCWTFKTFSSIISEKHCNNLDFLCEIKKSLCWGKNPIIFPFFMNCAHSLPIIHWIIVFFRYKLEIISGKTGFLFSTSALKIFPHQDKSTLTYSYILYHPPKPSQESFLF